MTTHQRETNREPYKMVTRDEIAEIMLLRKYEGVVSAAMYLGLLHEKAQRLLDERDIYRHLAINTKIGGKPLRGVTMPKETYTPRDSWALAIDAEAIKLLEAKGAKS